jgi:hypothetical protein
MGNISHVCCGKALRGKADVKFILEKSLVTLYAFL